jgi:TctA family transporter
MNRKLLNASALAAALMLSTTALAQDGTTSTAFLITSFASTIGGLAALIWLILFARWGGFRYLI